MTHLHCPTCGRPHFTTWADLTAREREVLQAIRLGLRNKTIAYQMGISEGTVKVYVRAIMDKLGVRTRTAVAML